MARCTSGCARPKKPTGSFLSVARTARSVVIRIRPAGTRGRATIITIPDNRGGKQELRSSEEVTTQGLGAFGLESAQLGTHGGGETARLDRRQPHRHAV